MDNEKKSGCNVSISTGVLGLLFLVMFVLKTCGIGIVANWSWWWITAPLWGPFAAFLLLALIIGIISLL